MKGTAGLLFSLIIAVCSYRITAQTVECENATPADIVFLVASSGFQENFEEVQTFLRNIFRAFDIGPNTVQIGLAQYNTGPHEEFLLKDHTDKRFLLTALENVGKRHRGGGPNTGRALEFLLEQYFTKDAGSRASLRVPQIAVVITDRKFDDQVTAPAQRLRAHGVIVFVIGVGEFKQEELQSVASWPPNRFVLPTRSYRALLEMTGKVLNSVCTSVVDQRIALADRYADIFFLVDSNLAQSQSSMFRTDLVKLVNQLNVGASTYRVGLAQYSGDVKVEFRLNSFKTRQETLTAVRRLRLRPQPNQPHNLGNALRYARTQFFMSEAGGRAEQGSRQFLVVVTGKESDDHVVREAQSLESSGITVVGMSTDVDKDVLANFATTGYTFDSLKATLLKDIFTTELKEDITEDCKGANVADIVFIVDESGSIGGDNFQLMRTFLGSIVSGLNISENRVRVGIVTYNEIPTAQAYLNTFKNKADILQFISILPYSEGGTNTGAALNFTREQIFTVKRGSRKDIQKVVVVITDGKSNDSVSEAAALLRRTGVKVYAVGIKDANVSELHQMASDPSESYVFKLERFTELKPLKQNLQKTLCTNIINEAVTTTKADTKEACKQKDEADIYFLIDDSGSINAGDFTDMRKCILEFVDIFHIGPQYVRMGLAKYADLPSLEFDLKSHSDKTSLKEAVGRIHHAGGGTQTGKALSYMIPLFKSARGAPVPKYLIVITDGNSYDPVKSPAEELRTQGVITFAIGVKESNKTQLQEIAGDTKRTFYVNNFDGLKSITSSIFTEMCIVDACTDVPFDIIFLADSSESIEAQDYQKMKDFMKSIVGKSTIGQNDVHVGVMQYSTNDKLEFSLNKFQRKDEMLQTIQDMQQIKDGTHTGKAIQSISRYFDATEGGRPGLKQYLIVITDGESKDNVKAPAEALRGKGVVIYAFGVGKANTTQLRDISGSQDKVFYRSNFEEMKTLDRQLFLKFCKEDCKKTKTADIIFLVDGSGSISTDAFTSMKKFMSSVVNRTTVGSTLTQFGLILYSDDPNSVFTLNTYNSKQGVIDGISNTAQPTGNTYTSKALQYSLQFFKDEHGGRKASKVPQILMVITDGEANDRQTLKPSSDELRKYGVTIFSIGVKDAKREELEIMAGGDLSKVFFVDNFEALETLYKNISSVICNHTKPVCEKDKADLVFLLDRSSSIHPDNYTIMKNFTEELVNSFKVSKDNVQFGLAQFSTEPHHEFYFNTYTNKENMIAHIRNMEYTGGNTNLGAALAHIKKYFESSHGSRKAAKIPQNLLVITDGDSQDDVEEAADELRAKGVVMFAVAIGDVHDLQLLQITGTPERLFPVQTFSLLTTIKKKVVDAMCKDKPIVDPTDCTIDIAMGFDISRRTGEMLISGQHKLRIFLPEIVHYLSSVPGLCCIGFEPVKTRIAFQVIDRDGSFLYDTNFEVYNPDVVEKIINLRLSTSTYFNTALLDSFKKKFRSQSNAGVKVLVIFSDGLDEDVMKLEHESELLRQSGVSALLTVALEGAHHPTDLQMVEFGRGFGYKLPLSIVMPSVGSTILKVIDAVSDRECCNVACKCFGHEGPRGDPGTRGMKGLSGEQGQQGFPGEEGSMGERGPPGPSGPQGLQGCPGAIGQKGYRGVSGNRGDTGEDALDGINGEQGMTGRDGARGQRGDPGSPGIPGITGEKGVKGDRGLRGDPGEPGRDDTTPGAKGDPGNPGLPGLPGADGRAGGKGADGSPGPDGRRGSYGEKGVPGDRGARGPPGIPGAPGPQGGRGPNGERGPDGIPGFPGPQGNPGTPGNPGSRGRRGPNGQKGQPGDSGIKGAPGSEGSRGLPGEDGRDGHGTVGPPGVKGDRGFPGYPGLAGADGDPGTKGYSGHKGIRGRPGNSGLPGRLGEPGEHGHPGHRGQKGPPGQRETVCELINKIKDNCDKSKCPVYPTELVFALDMSEDVNQAIFNRHRSALLSLLENVAIAESNCPTGARVAVVGYSTSTKYLIRFHDYRHKKQLIEAVNNITFGSISSRRHLASSMLFVARNVFKRTRAGDLMRKVAIFFTNGPSQDSPDIITALMEYQALNIKSAVIAMRNLPAISRALEVDDTGNSIFAVLGRAADLRRVRNCLICYDPCRPLEECVFIQDMPKPQTVDVDLVMVADSSREMQADEYIGTQQLLGSVVEHLAVSQQPSRPDNQARVAVVQSGARVPKLEFGLQTYQNQVQMKSQIQKMQQQGKSSTLGQTLDFSLKQVLLKASQPRKKRALMVVVGSQTIKTDQAKLQYLSKKAKCKGVALFVVTVGSRYSRAQVEELASLPVQQHLIHVDRLRPDEQGYAQRFFRVFLSALNKDVNTYPPPSLKTSCDSLPDEDEDEEILLNGQGSAEAEELFRDEAEKSFQMQTRGGTQIRQLDVFNTATLSEDDLNVPTDMSKTQLSISPAHSKDACFLTYDAGSCWNYTIMWYFDANEDRCSLFWYGGCGGNENRFETEEVCVNLCVSPGRR